MFDLLIGLTAFPSAAWFMYLGWLWYADARKAVKWTFMFDWRYDNYEEWHGSKEAYNGKPSHPFQALIAFISGIMMIVVGIYYWSFIIL